ncbi:MAG: undecaprenyl-phosphate glucose phosphotransferase [Anaerolineae bacterium]|nr:undecaprenyl-phosphate glucose phosphotransferase [Anaerolineae bacterium]
MSNKQAKALLSVSLLLTDALLVTLGFALGYWLRATIPLPAQPESFVPLSAYTPVWFVYVVSVLVAFYLYRLYHMRRASSRVDQAYTIAAAVSIGTLLQVAVVELLLKNTLFADYPRGILIYAWLTTILLVILGREMHRRLVMRFRRRGVACDRVLIVGSGEIARAIVQKIQLAPDLGYRVVGIIHDADRRELLGVPVVGDESRLSEAVDEYEVDEVIIALPEASSLKLLQLTSAAQRGRVSIKVYPDLFQIMAGGVTIDDLGGLPLLDVRDVALHGWKLSLKRGLDVFGAVAGLVLLSPFMLLTALLVRLSSPGPVFICQERMGLDGRRFYMVKFRSMRQDAEVEGPGWTVENDPRITRLGAWMRAKDWDEILQLINVLLGDMSLVGPRPERPVYVERFQQSIPRYMERHREKAGMTGWAQVNGLRGDTSIVERTKYDLWYIENWSIWLDLRIIIRTIIQIIFR